MYISNYVHCSSLAQKDTVMLLLLFFFFCD